MMWEGRADFEHFSVEYLPGEPEDDIPDLAGLMVEVCLTQSLNGDAPTRISLDPWSLEDSLGRTQRPQQPGSHEPQFPAQGEYTTGECTRGFLTFDLITDPVDWVNLVYENGLGDRAVWQFH